VKRVPAAALLAVAALLWAAASAHSHSVQPAFLEIVESADGKLDITWKVPRFQGKALEISPVFPARFTRVSPKTTMDTPLAIVDRWSLRPDEGGPGGQEIAIEGLSATMSDVLIRIQYADGAFHRIILRPNEPTALLPERGASKKGGAGLAALGAAVDRGRLPLLLLGAFALALLPASRRRGIVQCTTALAMGALLGFTLPQLQAPESLASSAPLDGEEGVRVIHGLLLNTYRSFSLEGEEAVYDQLARSVDGDLLAEVYLQNRDAMTIDEAEGAATIIDRLDVKEIESIERDGNGGWAVRANWDVYGSVRHWGHVHYRCNTYRAELTLVPADDYWKLRRVQILDEERVI